MDLKSVRNKQRAMRASDTPFVTQNIAGLPISPCRVVLCKPEDVPYTASGFIDAGMYTQHAMPGEVGALEETRFVSYDTPTPIWLLSNDDWPKYVHNIIETE